MGYIMDMTHATPELFAAMAAAQGEIENASKNSNNPHFRSKYADLAEVENTVRAVLPKHGIAHFQMPSFDGALVNVTTVIAHSGGGYVSGVTSCVPAKTDAQGIGAASTYCRRYGLAAIAGIAQEDDDGNLAQHGEKPKKHSDETLAKYNDFTSAINDAQDVIALSSIAKDLPNSGIPSDLMANLRALYSARNKKLQQVAA